MSGPVIALLIVVVGFLFIAWGLTTLSPPYDSDTQRWIDDRRRQKAHDAALSKWLHHDVEVIMLKHRQRVNYMPERQAEIERHKGIAQRALREADRIKEEGRS